MRAKRRGTRARWWACCWLIAAAGLRAERLPVDTLTVNDGLPSDSVTTLLRDSHGYLWVGTADGLAVYDGWEFHTFTRQDGLPAQYVLSLAETKDGSIWVGTGAGLCRFSPRPGKNRCAQVLLGGSESRPEVRAVRKLAAAPDGTLWIGTRWGLYRGRPSSGSWTAEPVVPDRPVNALTVAPDGTAYASNDRELLVLRAGSEPVAILHGGRGERYAYISLHVDQQGRLWGGLRQHLVRLELQKGKQAVIAQSWAVSTWDVHAIIDDQNHGLWLATGNGLVHFEPPRGPGPPRLQRYGREHGLPDDGFSSLVWGDQGTLWVGSSGLVRYHATGARLYTAADGLPAKPVHILETSRSGHIVAITGGDGLRFSYFEEGRFHPLHLPVVRESLAMAYQDRALVQTPSGEWWLAVPNQLYRFPAVSRPALLAGTRPLAVYPIVRPLTIYAARNGDVWVSNRTEVTADLTRWEAATRQLHRYTATNLIPKECGQTVAIGEDAHGVIWFGAYRGGLFRFRAGRFEAVRVPRETNLGTPQRFVLDATGRLLLSSIGGGVMEVVEPESDQPRFLHLLPSAELPVETAGAIAVDHGSIYVNTTRGLVQIDPQRRTRMVGSEFGLPVLIDVAADGTGNVWVCGPWGVARFAAGAAERPGKAPPVFLRGIRVAGADLPVPEFGAATFPGFETSAGRNTIVFSYAALSFAAGDSRDYEYRLLPNGQWLRTRQRAVDFANLGPGQYRFEVRAVISGGTAVSAPATVEFEVLPPFWRRWWFLLAVAVGLSGMAHFFYRSRLRRYVELERVRTRIATDLHDDIGSSLSRIAILSDVAKRRLEEPDGSAAPLLDEIAAQSRSLIDSMSDVVWTINPKRDRASDLAARVREFAGGTLEPLGIEWSLTVDPELESISLPMEMRRNLLLMFKEAVHNAAKHARPREVRLRLEPEGRHLVALIADDGRGFDAEAPSEGNGLPSLAARAAQLKGTLEVESKPGGGTALQIRIPLPR